jgi:hypothetical protein
MVEGAAQAAALAAVGGGGGARGGGGSRHSGGSSGGHSSGGGESELVDALTARVMRAAEASLGGALDSSARAALGRRLVWTTDGEVSTDGGVDKAALLVRRLALHELRSSASTHVLHAQTRTRDGRPPAPALAVPPACRLTGLCRACFGHQCFDGLALRSL